MKKFILLALIFLFPSLAQASNLVHMDFDGVDIKVLTQVVSETVGKPVLYPEGFNQTVHLISPTPVMPQVFLKMYSELVRDLGYNVFEYRNYWKISKQVRLETKKEEVLPDKPKLNEVSYVP